MEISLPLSSFIQAFKLIYMYTVFGFDFPLWMGSKKWFWEEKLRINVKTSFFEFNSRKSFFFFHLVFQWQSMWLQVSEFGIHCCSYFWSIWVYLLDLQCNITFLMFNNVLLLCSNWHYLSCPPAPFEVLFLSASLLILGLRDFFPW